MTIRTESELLALIDQPNSNITLGNSTINRQVLRDLVESISSIAGPGGASDDYILIRDEKASGTDGGTFTSGAFRTRDLNTLVSDVGGHASIASNQITLAAGTYRLKVSAPAQSVDEHKTRLRNITDGTTIQEGTSEIVLTAAVQSRSFISGRFTLAASKVLEVQHRCVLTNAGDGFGEGEAAFGVTEVYTTVEFWKEQ